MACKRRLSLVVKFNILTIVLIIITSMGIALFVVRNEMNKRYNDLLESGISIASMASENSEYAIYTRNKDAIKHVFDSIKVNKNIAYVSIIDINNNIIAETMFIPNIKIPNKAYNPNTYKHNKYIEFINTSDRRTYINIYTPVLSVSGVGAELNLGTGNNSVRKDVIGHVQVGLTTEGLHNSIRYFLISTMLFTAFIVVIGIIFTILMTRKIAFPIKELALLTQDISEGNFDHKVELKSNDEVSDLALAFNRMLVS